ncbi:hypothetical protein IQ276_008095 [Desmonostoc muscorum LEGE 12446]|nr:hypothetical protein [Desmonostoc muscorum LEGE 12446]
MTSQKLCFREFLDWGLGTGDWGLGTGDWGLGTGDWGLGTGDWGLGTGDWGLGTGDWGLGTGDWGLGTGDWGLGTGDWGLGTGDWEKFLKIWWWLKAPTIIQYAWVKASTLCQSHFFYEPQRRREASALGGFPDLFAQRRPQEKQLARHREKREREGKNA